MLGWFPKTQRLPYQFYGTMKKTLCTMHTLLCNSCTILSALSLLRLLCIIKYIDGLQKDRKYKKPDSIQVLRFIPRFHGSSMSVFSVYWQPSQGRMANFPAFIASKSVDIWNHHIPQMKFHDMQHILMY